MHEEMWEVFFNWALYCFCLHLLSTASLSWRVGADPDIVETLFGRPVWQKVGRGFMALLKLRYFWPLSKSPELLSSYPMTTRGLFWVARLTGAGLVVLIALFFISIFVTAGSLNSGR